MSWCSGSKAAGLKPWRWNRRASTEIALFQKLEAAGFEVLLVDARRARHVPGRKSDVQDCRWLQQLHSDGLLAPAFRPEDAICRLRTLQRHRKSLVECAAMWMRAPPKGAHGDEPAPAPRAGGHHRPERLGDLGGHPGRGTQPPNAGRFSGSAGQAESGPDRSG